MGEVTSAELPALHINNEVHFPVGRLVQIQRLAFDHKI